MNSRKLLKAVAGSVVFLGLGVSLAHAAADDAIKGRQNCMKNGNGAMMGVMVPMMKGEKPYDAAMVKEALAKDAENCGGWAGWWGADTQKGETLETWAKPEIWTDTAGFEAAGAAYVKALTEIGATMDEAGFKAAFPALGAACQGCHEKFRRPKE